MTLSLRIGISPPTSHRSLGALYSVGDGPICALSVEYHMLLLGLSLPRKSHHSHSSNVWAYIPRPDIPCFQRCLHTLPRSYEPNSVSTTGSAAVLLCPCWQRRRRGRSRGLSPSAVIFQAILKHRSTFNTSHTILGSANASAFPSRRATACPARIVEIYSQMDSLCTNSIHTQKLVYSASINLNTGPYLCHGVS